MMTGIPIVNNIIYIYEFILLCCIAGFAVYDLYQKRVPNQALAFFCPLFGIAPLLHTDMSFPLSVSLGASFCGATVSFLLLLTAAITSGNGTGIGGGDIKLGTLLGFAYGTRRILTVLLIASLLAGCAALISHKLINHKKKKDILSLPFVPFLAVGSLIATLTALF